uniref:Uncharacterized protein n=1 Tax=Candidatus Kentrum eta TaxID=2126337 RepID=A0A450VGG8_9GAMM|nr:MAG: hypothetical protein BECKH772C_GA0070978_101506 [Candidatus Kentron sp. H]VFK04454.1 MAG: hypothetical protein BECKH772B_GA0070898_104451 [Candidatus Kentron sp. H]VFK04649.1 MAG: hypothetical protein BECKH772A_GA0070896_104431 [Candidatus Kentron sp. H]
MSGFTNTSSGTNVVAEQYICIYVAKKNAKSAMVPMNAVGNSPTESPSKNVLPLQGAVSVSETGSLDNYCSQRP